MRKRLDGGTFRQTATEEEMLDAWKAKERAVRGAKLPLSDEQFKALFDFLSVEFPNQGLQSYPSG